MQDASHRVDRLWPDPAADLDLDIAFGELGLEPVSGRPVVGDNMLTSIDGRAQLHGTAEGLGGRADRRLMQLVRAAYDAVGGGVGTLRADDFYSRLAPDLAARREAAGRPAQPLAVLIGGAEEIPVDRRWFRAPDPGQRRIVAVGAGSPHAGSHPLPGVETWVAPTPRPEPSWLLERLAAEGVRSLLLEGGPHLNAAFLAAGLLDELYWTVGARIVGAPALPMIAPLTPSADGGGVALPVEARLLSIHRSGDELYLRYRLATAPGAG